MTVLLLLSLAARMAGALNTSLPAGAMPEPFQGEVSPRPVDALWGDCQLSSTLEGAVGLMGRSDAEIERTFAQYRQHHHELYAGTPPPPRPPRLVAEFEPAATLIMAFSPVAEYGEFYAQVIEAASSHGRVEVLVDGEHRPALDSLLSDRPIRGRSLRFVEDVPFESPWVRDYGPQATVDGRGMAFIDGAFYVNCPEADAAPTKLAQRAGVAVYRHPLWLEGGNLLSNGRGLCLTTTTLSSANGMTEAEAAGVLRDYHGCTRTVFLLPMAGNVVDHVDMFATFAAEDVLLLGEYEPEQDPLNHLVLEVNASILAEVELPAGGALRLVRVPMADHAANPAPGGAPIPRSYLNLTVFNGIVLVPVYDSDPVREGAAIDALVDAFPGRELVPVLSDEPALDGGAVHCLTLTIPRRRPLPRG